MPSTRNKRRRKLPLIAGPSIHTTKLDSSQSRPRSNVPKVSRKITQSTITSFHNLLKQKAILQRQLRFKAEDDPVSRSLLDGVEEQLRALGGIEAYQAASKLGQSGDRGGDSSKVLIEWLKDTRSAQFKGKGKNRQIEDGSALQLLEIGALTPDNYASCSTWINNHPIDLNSQHPEIVEQDFFERPLTQEWSQQFDVISCSLVLNFVSDPRDRGRMLSLIHQHLRPVNTSLLFLVLPLPCLDNSRYLSVNRLQEIMAVIGFELVKERWKNGGKVGYWLWSWCQPFGKHRREDFKKKKVLDDGPKKNNFCILL